MKKFVLTIVYGSIASILLLLVKTFFGIGSSWWLDSVIIIISLFIGVSMFAQFHGVQVYLLKHLGSVRELSKFQVNLKVGGQGTLNIVGEYTRGESYGDLELQSRIFKALNSSPGNEGIKQFASRSEEKTINILIEDPDMPEPINFTQIRLEKFEQGAVPTMARVEKSLENLNRYDIGMKLWEQEQELLAKARKDGVEAELIAYWEAQGRPRMKKPPSKEE